jgi:iron complex outermembrane receptor protein/hemoglobin/transferrin/lactoferrin receptor protein
MLQDQLALSDTSDERIPAGGTPGFAVADLRMGYRFGAAWTISLVAENLTDAVYRYHGSAVNGPARGLKLGLNYRPKIGSKL